MTVFLLCLSAANSVAIIVVGRAVSTLSKAVTLHSKRHG